MLVETSIRIQRPADAVWGIVADDFAGIQNWFEDVVRSYELPDAPRPGDSPSAGRVCEFTDRPDGLQAREQITSYDRDTRKLSFEVVPVNAPAALPLKKNLIDLEVREVGPNESEVIWQSSPQLKAYGYLMYPMLKMGLNKTFSDLLTQLKAHAER